MVNFVLDNLGCPACEGFDSCLEFGCLPLHFYTLKTLTLTRTTEQRKAPFFRLIRVRFFDNFRVEHCHICTVVIKTDNALMHTNHIGSHTNTTLSIGNKGVQQILCHLQIFNRRLLRFYCQQNRVVYYFFNHKPVTFNTTNYSPKEIMAYSSLSIVSILSQTIFFSYGKIYASNGLV